MPRRGTCREAEYLGSGCGSSCIATIILSKSTLDGVACMSEDRVPGDWTEEFVSAMFGNGQRLTDSLVTLVSSVATSYVCVSYGNYCIPVIR